MIVTFDNKAKEIIKNIVTQGDTPEPTPTPSELKFETLPAGNYRINTDKLLELLIAKGVDVDYENPGTNDMIMVGLNVTDDGGTYYSSDLVQPMYLYFGHDYGRPELYFNGFNSDSSSFKATDEPTIKTVKTYLEVLSAEDLTFTINNDIIYIPLFISTINADYKRLALTTDEINTFIVAE